MDKKKLKHSRCTVCGKVKPNKKNKGKKKETRRRENLLGVFRKVPECAGNRYGAEKDKTESSKEGTEKVHVS